jgi:hypothetical protein
VENKHLLILFGQYRNFDSIAPQLKFDGFDVIASTWDMAYSGTEAGATGDWRIPISKDDITKFIPNTNVLVWEHYLSDKMFGFRNTAKMLFHFKKALEQIEDGKVYDTITLQRFDLFSNMHEIQTMELEDDVLYCDHTGENETYNPHDLRIQDWMFFGKHDIVKKYIELFEYDDIPDAEAHSVQGRHLIKHNINRKPIKGTGIKYTLLKDFDGMGYTRWLNNFNKDYKFFDLSPNSKPYREFVNFTGQIWDKY